MVTPQKSTQHNRTTSIQWLPAALIIMGTWFFFIVLHSLFSNSQYFSNYKDIRFRPILVTFLTTKTDPARFYLRNIQAYNGKQSRWQPVPVFSYKLRYIVGFSLVETAVSTNQKPTMYRNLYENTAPGDPSSLSDTGADTCVCYF